MLRSVDAFRELRSSEARLADAQRLARLGNWEWDLETGTVVASPEAFAILELDGSTSRTTSTRFARCSRLKTWRRSRNRCSR